MQGWHTTYLNFKSGIQQFSVPPECVAECSRPGPCDDDARRWRAILEFSPARDDAVSYIAEYGAWDDDELDAMSEDELAEIIVWLAVGDICAELEESESNG